MSVSRPRTVVVADDDAGIRMLATRALTAAGYEVRSAADGDELIKEMEAEPAEAIVTDIIMPNREGVETIIEVKRRWPDTVVVAVSGGGRITPEAFLGLAASFGATVTLAKPFTMGKLVEALATARGAGRSAEPRG